MGGTNMEKKRDIKGSKGVTVGDKERTGWGGGRGPNEHLQWALARLVYVEGEGWVGAGSLVSPNWLTKLLK